MDYGEESIKQQARAACMAGWSHVKVCGRGLGLRGQRDICPLCQWHKSATAAAVCGLWRHLNVICLCLMSVFIIALLQVHSTR